jgi:hypothetical protein
MFSKAFWKAAFERMVRAAISAVIGVLGGTVLDVFNADWKTLGSVAIGAALTSLLMSLLSTGFTGSPGLTETPDGKIVALQDAKQNDVVVAGPASPVQDGERVTVTRVPGRHEG